MAERKPCTNAGCAGTYPPAKRRKTTICKTCSNRRNAADPTRRERISQSMRELYRDPEFRKRREPIIKALVRRNKADPVWVAKVREMARELGKKHGGTVAGSPSRVKSGRSLTERYLGHIPPEYRDEYRRLQRKTHLTAAEISTLILEMVEADLRRHQETGRLPQRERVLREQKRA